jgi:hypothetical protein
MYTRTNARNKTNFVGHNTTGVEIYLSTPVAKAKKASRLTLRSGKSRVDLNGRQIKALRDVLMAGYNPTSTQTSQVTAVSATRATRVSNKA